MDSRSVRISLTILLIAALGALGGLVVVANSEGSTTITSDADSVASGDDAVDLDRTTRALEGESPEIAAGDLAVSTDDADPTVAGLVSSALTNDATTDTAAPDSGPAPGPASSEPTDADPATSSTNDGSTNTSASGTNSGGSNAGAPGASIQPPTSNGQGTSGSGSTGAPAIPVPAAPIPSAPATPPTCGPHETLVNGVCTSGLVVSCNDIGWGYNSQNQCTFLGCPSGYVQGANGCELALTLCPQGQSLVNGQCVNEQGPVANGCPAGTHHERGPCAVTPPQPLPLPPLECPAGTVEANGACISVAVALPDCPLGEHLENSVCVKDAATILPDCPTGEHREGTACVPDLDGLVLPQCGLLEHLENGVCVRTQEPPTDPICAVGEHVENGACVPDVVGILDPVCGPGQHIENHVCVPDASIDGLVLVPSP